MNKFFANEREDSPVIRGKGGAIMTDSNEI